MRKIAPTAALEAGGNATSRTFGSGGSKLGEKILKEKLQICEQSSYLTNGDDVAQRRAREVVAKYAKWRRQPTRNTEK